MSVETSPLCLTMEDPECQDVDKCCEKLRVMRDRIGKDSEVWAIIGGFADSIHKLQKAMGRGQKLQLTISYCLQFADQLLSGHESMEAANSILALSVPQKKADLLQLNVKIKHCVENFEDNMDTVKRCYRNINGHVSEQIPDTNCPADAQESLLDKIHYAAEVAADFIQQSIEHGQETLDAIAIYNRETNVYHFGYRSVLHAILLLVATGMLITKGFQGFETFIAVGCVIYVILENFWWYYAKYKIAVARNGIDKQMKRMKILKERLNDLTSNSQIPDN